MDLPIGQQLTEMLGGGTPRLPPEIIQALGQGEVAFPAEGIARRGTGYGQRSGTPVEYRPGGLNRGYPTGRELADLTRNLREGNRPLDTIREFDRQYGQNAARYYVDVVNSIVRVRPPMD
jgi:hypothetical protein